ITDLSSQNEELTQETISKVAEQNTEFVKKLIDETQKTVNEQKEYSILQIKQIYSELQSITKEHENKLTKEQKILDDYIELASSTAELSKNLKSVDFPKRLDTIAKSIELTKNNIINTNSKIENLEDNNDKLLSNTQKIIDDRTNVQTLSIVRTIQNDKKPQEILDNTANINKKVKTTSFLVLLIFIFSVIFYAFMSFVFLTFFPHFFKDMF
ncbi:MAG: hypothetical protein U9Q83_10395, partial [Bacteroidota bacterium]|nr:hypothetical protein [Bacteroidota bacterium]